ncbi:MAG TPA: hypothetical protein VIH86_00970 [Puia sp.]
MEISRKVIIVDELIDKAISNICNAALKYEGLTMVASVNAVKCSIIEEPIEEKMDIEEEW